MFAHLFQPACGRPSLAALALITLAAVAAVGGPAARAQEFTFPSRSDEVPVLTAIEISGNEHSDRSLVLRIMALEIGRPLTLDDMDRAWDSLEDCGFFRFVEMEYDDEEPGEVVLRVILEEDLSTYYGPLLRYDRRFKYLAGGQVELRNLRGKGEKLRIEAAPAYIQHALVSWDRPWFLGRKGLQARVEVSGRQGGFVHRPFRFRKWDAAAEVRWSSSGGLFLDARFGVGQFERRDGFAWPSPVRGDEPAGATDLFLPGIDDLTVVELAGGWDSRDNAYYPQGGIFCEGRARRWTSDATPTYLETSLDARAFLPLPWSGHLLALHAWGRTTDRPAHLDNLLFLGGPGSVRGLPLGVREGDSGYLLSAEYRIPLFLLPISPQGELVGFGIHFFGDAGDAWFHGDEAGRAIQSLGAGAHLNLDTLQLRFEGARTSEGDWRFEFMDTFNF
ncbi:BamA/TamA family outer membrane protein [bacterium]|nr:BamA/TamA family outer membrane protein [bacterium]